MLIRNVKSKHDLENRKKLQAELLQVQIDNEALQEQRVKDYKNPNKPPPVPPQYKSNSDMQKDDLIQQKEAIDNLRTLNLDFAIASQITQDLTKLPDGIANLVKLNKNFPFIKEDITKKFNPKYLDAQTIIEYLKEYFAEIDTSIGINLAGSSSTNFFNSGPTSGAMILPSYEAFYDLRQDVEAIFNLFNLNPNDVKTILDQLAGIRDISPTDDELKSIDTFPVIERQRLNKTIERLIKVYKIPTASFVYEIIKKLDAISSTAPAGGARGLAAVAPPTPQELQYTLATLKNTLAQVDVKAQAKLDDFVGEIQAEQAKILQAQAGLLTVNVPANLPLDPAIQGLIPPANIANPQELRDFVIADNEKYINEKIFSGLTSSRARKRMTDPRRASVYGDQFLNQVATIDGNPPLPDLSNVIFEKQRRGELSAYKQLNPPELLNKTKVDVGRLPIALDRFLLIATIQGGLPLIPTTLNATKGQSRFTQEELRTIVNNIEGVALYSQLADDPNYDPKHNPAQHYIPEQGFGITNKVIKHFEKDNKEMMKLKKSYNKHLKTEKKADDESSSDEEKMGKGKMAFKGRRIKLGKGIAIKDDEPTYREFGKYVIHYPHLVNNNLLNVKYPSLGSIPAIKIVNVDDNFKDFMVDVLEKGRVNQRHYNSLTEPEKTHFVKVARGAGLLGILGVSSSGDDQESKDIKRLELLFGEINAGNDNDKMIKECKTLIKKYVANGRINKNKGLEMLMELD